MGNGEADKSSKEGKETKERRTPASQEQTSAASSVPGAADWSGFQAYSHLPPHGFLASSPQAHPYMWGVQQFMPPYGTPPHPYVAMYPHGAMYGHPAMAPGSYPFNTYALPSPNGVAEATGHAHGNMMVDGKSSEEKGKLPIKRSKPSFGSSNMINGKKNQSGKTTGASTISKSAESASEGSSDGSNATSQNDSTRNSDHHPDSAEPSQNGSGGPHSSQNGRSSVPHSMGNHAMIMPMPVAAVGPTTNLNIGMDYWGSGPASAVPAMQGNASSTPLQEGMIPNGITDGVQPHLWIQDEREIKKERRKQSNRESARRSRLRKQAECEELAKRAEALNEENASLRAELARLRSASEQLLAQNASLKEKLGDLETSNSHGGQDKGSVLVQCSKQKGEEENDR